MNEDKQLQMLKDMIRIRTFETSVGERFQSGEIPGFLHLYLGEEAIAVGACAALNRDDYITSTHRGHGHVLAKGANVSEMMAELYGKVTGCNKGKGGSMHIAVPELGILGANGIVGGGIPLAVGAGLSAKYLKNGRVTVCFFGDGASNEGTFHEALNIATAFDLPVIFICENNLYSASSPLSIITKIKDIAKRADGYGMNSEIIDGNDVIAVYEATQEAVNRARTGDGPTLIECKTYRWTSHCVGDPETRPKEEIEHWFSQEPIQRFLEKLKMLGIASNDILDRYSQEATAEINAAIVFAQNSPEPSVDLALLDVFTE